MSRQRILVLNQYYWPGVEATAHLLTELCEALAEDYREQVQYDGLEDLDRIPSLGGSHDIHAQLAAAATPLEFQATLETKFASYDNYCNLFH